MEAIKPQLKNVWLIKHPITEHYEETQKQAKRLTLIDGVKIFDEKLRGQIDPDLIVDHKLTEKGVAKAAPKKKAAKKKAKKGEPVESEDDSTEDNTED